MYKRPHFKEFISKVSQISTVSIFTQSQRSFAEPIIDQLDPEKKLFKHRFYSENCFSNGDGEIIKDMSVMEELIIDPTQKQQGPEKLSFTQRINQALGGALSLGMN